ncbi:CTP synthase [Streptomyces gardneri]|uniref:CTP synthase C-terminal region-related (seleno)protein n=1 Tax=Nocardia TaxID=1817 RepID=UPI00135A3157|nr:MULTISPECIES: CTP synthase [Nocardia]MBF6169211.1 CTP synthase [Streptomyces gardneri]MBF6208303.1 CTP synthase [Streptomyces gardneri]UAK31265.1 CTP synthase [Nocardia asteroides]
MDRSLLVAVVGDRDPNFVPHGATDDALEHAAAHLGIEVDIRWLATEPLEADLGEVKTADVLWCAPGSPYRSLRGAVAALRHGRESGVPTLGTCGGCQHMVIEYARTVLGYADAQHAEYDPYASTLFVSELTCSLAGKTMPVSLVSGSRVAALYGRTEVEEEYYCNFGLDTNRQDVLHAGGFLVTGVDGDGAARVLEVPGHPFYVATLFVPQARSRPEAPHPLVVGLLRAAL